MKKDELLIDIRGSLQIIEHYMAAMGLDTLGFACALDSIILSH